MAGSLIPDRPPKVGHRFVIETRDDMQVRVEAALIVPAERVAVRSEPLAQLCFHEKPKFPRPSLEGRAGVVSRRLSERGRASLPDRDGP